MRTSPGGAGAEDCILATLEKRPGATRTEKQLEKRSAIVNSWVGVTAKRGSHPHTHREEGASDLRCQFPPYTGD
ncbi:unnamed protein product [Rangifer tarandus platyrhynchus]|uniref:Uncharacterized protein n=2 Tax=Rangifer tarandus platyrhynchus TaxID=3082113 RepID=A0ABN8XZV1_RANTA|nr:unnamed protein product [Rangifer tarandus platyrhynchus]CAI9712645.1 unnamed protein product [Rangifer tarandus platyrhynchus]